MKRKIFAIIVELIPLIALVIALVNLFGAECEIYIVYACAAITLLGFVFAIIGKKLFDSTGTKVLRILDYMCIAFTPLCLLFANVLF